MNTETSAFEPRREAGRDAPAPGGRPTRAARRASGFTLIEVLVVLVIIGILISMVAPNVLNRVDQAKQQKVFSDFKAIQTALTLYKLDNHKYPASDGGLQSLVSSGGGARNFRQGGYLTEVPKDPWGHNYLYLFPGQHGEYDIYTLGADGVAGGIDQNADTGNWSQ